MNPRALQSRFVCGLEARYAHHVEWLQAAGMDPEQAHLRALEHVKEFGRLALEELTHRGLFPWPDEGVGDPTGGDVRGTGREVGHA